MHTCQTNCKGLSLEYCSRKTPPAECKICNGIIGYSELVAYAHAYRATQAGQSGWYHIECLRSALLNPSAVGKKKITKYGPGVNVEVVKKEVDIVSVVLAPRKTYCVLSEKDIVKDTPVVRLQVGNHDQKIVVSKKALEKLLSKTEEELHKYAKAGILAAHANNFNIGGAEKFAEALRESPVEDLALHLLTESAGLRKAAEKEYKRRHTKGS